MKKFLAFAVIAAFLITPSLSFAKSVVMTDDELDAIVGQSGSVTVTFTDITIQSTPLKTRFTDGWNYWDVPGYKPSPHINNPPWFFYGTPEDNPQKHPGSGIFDTIGYFGYDFYSTGGLIKRSGSMTLEPLNITSTDEEYFGLNPGCKLMKITFNNFSFDAQIGMVTVYKIGATPNSSKAETIMTSYTGNLSIGSINGTLFIAARN